MPAKIPTGVPMKVAMAAMSALPTMALSKPPLLPGGGVIWVNRSVLNAWNPAAVQKKLTPIVEQRLQAKGLHFLAWGTGGWVQLFSKKELRTLDQVLLTDTNGAIWTRSQAVYADVTWDTSAHTSAELGLRYTHEDKRASVITRMTDAMFQQTLEV